MSRSIQQGSVPTAGNKYTIPYTEIIAWKQPHWKQDVKAFPKLLQDMLYIIYLYLFICTNVMYLQICIFLGLKNISKYSNRILVVPNTNCRYTNPQFPIRP
jgi:hypothetical protein